MGIYREDERGNRHARNRIVSPETISRMCRVTPQDCDLQADMKNKTWKNLSPDTAELVRQLLLREGGVQDDSTKGHSEAWRIRLESSVFTSYNTGTLYFSGGESETVSRVVKGAAQLVFGDKPEPDRDLLIGMDETGKGEVLGPSVLVVAVVRRNLASTIEEIIGVADTKKKRQFSTWDKLFRSLDQYRGRGLSYEIETIPPWDADKFNVNQIMDVVYQRLLSRLLQGLDPTDCRIILDDYNIGKNLKRYMQSLSTGGAEVRIEARADENYVEVRTASILSKWRRELAMRKIRENFSLPSAPMGSGNAGEPVTLNWLKAWKATGKPWPWFVKVSWKTVRQLDGWPDSPRKESPPIRHEILSHESQKLFREGRLSTSSLAIICPSCGTALRACKLTPDASLGLVGRCVGCNAVVQDLAITLRYYCGNAMLDSSTIISGAVSKDLDRLGFFSGHTFLLHPLVRAEIDSPGGNSKLEKLGNYAAMERIAIKGIDDSKGLATGVHDDIIIQSAKACDAILVTWDRGMYGN